MPIKPKFNVDKEMRLAEAELAAGNTEAALARMARIQEHDASLPDISAPAAAPAAAPPAELKKAATMAALPGAQVGGIPRGGTLVKLHGADGLKDLGLEKYRGRMGRVVEMVGRQFLEDGSTEVVTILLDSRASDYERGSGVWVQVPMSNLELQ